MSKLRYQAFLSFFICLGFVPINSLAYEFQIGSKITVVARSTKLMRGPHALANVQRGYRTTVTDVRGDWIGVEIDGKRGWLLRHDLAITSERNSATNGSATPVRSSSGSVARPSEISQSTVDRNTAQKTLEEAEESLWPVIDAYREAFRAAARSFAEQRQINSTEIERLRAQVNRLRQVGQIDKDLIQQVEPHLKRLESLLVVNPSSVLNNSPELQSERDAVVRKTENWNQAILRWSQTASQPHQTLVAVPSAEQFVQWQEELASQLALPMSDDERAALSENQHAASRLGIEEARSIHQLNQLRILIGVRPLKIDTALVATGRDHSHEMRTRNFFSHMSPVEGKHSPCDRGKRFGTVAWGENIAWGSCDATETMGMWFHSPGHLANLINVDYRRVGLGRSKNHWTQMFGP